MTDRQKQEGFGGKNMKSRLTLQQRLIFPIILLGLITLLSNIVAVFNINNVNSNAGTIVDDYMASETSLEEIRCSVMELHRLALSHIVAADHATMIRLVQQIKAQENTLDEKLADYTQYVTNEEESMLYTSLLADYDGFKHALVKLVCASADSKTEEAYAMANGDVAAYSTSTEAHINALYAMVSTQAYTARNRLNTVYLSSVMISAITLTLGVLLVIAAFRIIRHSVIAPMRGTVDMLQNSSDRISGVVGDVRLRTQTSTESVQALSKLTTQLSTALGQIAGNTSAIRTSASDTQEDSVHIAEECSAIASYSLQMRGRAEEVEQAARQQISAIRTQTEEILSSLDEAIQKSQSVQRISVLTKDILSISSSTDLIALNASLEATRAGSAGKGFAVVAREIRQLADSCAETAGHIQDVNTVVTEAVNYLAGNAQELVDYLSNAILFQFEQSAQSGKQYREDAVYIEHCMETFQRQAERLRTSMDEITTSITNISDAIEQAASGVNGAAGSTRSLVDDMAEITARMHTNQEIVEELQQQMELFSNL